MNIERIFFTNPASIKQKQYEALRSFHVDKEKAEVVAAKFNYTLSSFYSLIRDFKTNLSTLGTGDNFFLEVKSGRKKKENDDALDEAIIKLRKKYLPIGEIKMILDTEGSVTSESHIYHIIKKAGFARLPRRDKTAVKSTNTNLKIEAPISQQLEDKNDSFNTMSTGILAFLPYIKHYKIDKAIENSQYPETKCIPKMNSILSILALKLSNISRYSKDDIWCMDKGLGLFAGLNVLPKTAWFSSYSSRVTKEMNTGFLKNMNKIWKDLNLLSDPENLDFTTIPYWGDDAHLENNWAGKRNKSLSSILAVLAHDPASGIITYGDTTIRHSGESDTILEFLDFYKDGRNSNLKYLVFDSKFTTYQNLSKLDNDGIKFITIRRRGKKILEELELLTKADWTHIRVECANGKNRSLKVNDSIQFLKGYDKKIRQIAITGNGKIKPALIITNDLEVSKQKIVRKYAKRWLVDKTISEQVHFFHINKVSSSMVIKVDFDLTMTILAHNLYRLLARDLEGYENLSAESMFNKFIRNSGFIDIGETDINVNFKKKRNSPLLLTTLEKHERFDFEWLHGKKINFEILPNS
ncbi:MAG: transposase [Flavobacteriaceae bacterium]|nr:transposase [Flavobacteriaceae bacterium]